jgi:type IV pilus assembly protein PilQ
LLTKNKSSDNEHKISLQDIKFTKDEEDNLYIKLKFPQKINYTIKTENNNVLGIVFPNTLIPDALVKIYDLAAFRTNVKNVFLENSKKGGIVHISFFQRVPINIDYKNGYLTLKISSLPKNQVTLSKKIDKITPKKQTDVLEENGTLIPGMKKHYTGTPISIDLQDAEIKHVLRLLAEVGGYNLIIDEGVAGTISLKLKKVPWDQILDLVLLQKNLGMIKQGNILRIAPVKKIQQEQELMRRTLEQKKERAPIFTRYIKVNYATASEIAPKLEKFLTKRGSISYDSRTNQLIISDTNENLKRIYKVLKRLDQPERQVLIEARVVYASESFQRGLGIKWGGGFNTGATYSGSNFDIGLYGTQGDITATSTVSPSGFAINLPTDAATFGLGGYISKLTGSDFFTLDAQLALGESKGEVNTISSPRIITLNNHQAEVIQGTKIATKTESESGGTTTQYQDAVLKLSVLPQITPDNNLILDITISDDSPVGGGEDIETKQATTKLMVKDGETIVIGGVQRITESKQQNRVPFLSKIPIIGNAFKSNFKSQEKRELLIFIRPKIL